MAMFKGFKPQGLQKIAGRLGYTGSMDNFDNYLEQNPEKKRQMIVYEEAAKQMARGGVVKMQEEVHQHSLLLLLLLQNKQLQLLGEVKVK